MKQKCIGGYSTPTFTRRVAFCSATVFLLTLTYNWKSLVDISFNKIWPTSLGEFHNSNFTTTEMEPIHRIDADLVGHIWPKPGSLENRIVNQLNYMREYAAIRGDNRTDKKLILRVGDFNFNDIGWIEGQDRLKNDHCPITDCWFTSDKSLSTIADALLISEFSQNDLKYYTPKPKHQIWITQHLESPLHNRLDPNSLTNLVNWSATYRQESTLVLPYAAWTHKNNTDALNRSKINYAKGKTKKVAWFVSNCADKNGRRAYANELKKHIQVDIYGSCGSLSCAIVRGNVNCYAMLKKDYKFYLAFENSNCIGYITEKLHWNALTNDVIPVVMGARPQDYAAAVPPSSYMHVDDFESPRHLAEYLKVLDRNDTLYNEYFQYKQRWKMISLSATQYWCRLCALLFLRDSNSYVHWYDNYSDWWNGACKTSRDGKNKWQTW